MGYTTAFDGYFTVSPAMRPEHVAYLNKFSETRRMKRDVTVLAAMPDPIREAVGLPLGDEGEYFVGGQGEMGQDAGQLPPVKTGGPLPDFYGPVSIHTVEQIVSRPVSAVAGPDRTAAGRDVGFVSRD